MFIECWKLSISISCEWPMHPVASAGLHFYTQRERIRNCRHRMRSPWDVWRNSALWAHVRADFTSFQPSAHDKAAGCVGGRPLTANIQPEAWGSPSSIYRRRARVGSLWSARPWPTSRWESVSSHPSCSLLSWRKGRATLLIQRRSNTHSYCLTKGEVMCETIERTHWRNHWS